VKSKKAIFSFLFLSCFIEGGSLMAVEMLSSKIIAPYYGASLYVWATIIGVTMGGLTIGYFFGGVLSEKKMFTLPQLMMLFILSALCTFLIQVTSGWIMESTLHFDLRLGILVSCVIFLLPPIICFGIISPVIIQMMMDFRKQAGFSSGLIYSISTLGGILFTFLTGFVFISAFGVLFSINMVGLLLLVPPLIFGLSKVFNIN
jgi:hypothetical protein